MIIGQKTIKINELQRQKNELSRHLIEQNEDQELLSASQILELKSISPMEFGDSTFIRECLTQMYKDDLSRLNLKSLTGRRSRSYIKNGIEVQHRQKERLTPQKVALLTSLYESRVGCTGSRRKMLNQHITNGIFKINLKMENMAKRNLRC